MLDKPHMNIRLRGLEECDDVIFAGFSDSCNLPSKSLAIGVAHWFVHINQYKYLAAINVLSHFVDYLPVGTISHLRFRPWA